MPKELTDVEWPVSTARLTLRRATVDDADAVLSYRLLPHVAQWMGPPPEDFHARFAAPERLDLLLVVELAGEVIGDLMVKIEDAWSPLSLEAESSRVQAALGWSLAPEHTGRGYATEAVEAVLRICFDDLGLRRVTATCFAANEASWRLMERVGMRREASTVADALHPSGAWVDGYAYALLADEWRRRTWAEEARNRIPVTYDSSAHVDGPFYHGTKAALAPGTELVPGHGSNFQDGRVSNHIYFSARIETAVWGAELSSALGESEGRGHVYVVEPLGPFEDDPNVTDKRFPGNPTQSYRTRSALRVVDELEEWEGHDPAVVQGMLDSLARLREQGLDVIED